jgi:hypothetical protein
VVLEAAGAAVWGPVKRTPDLRKLAQHQRWLIWLVLVALVSQVLPALPWGGYETAVGIFVVVLWLITYLLMIAGVVLVLTAQGNHLLMIIVCGFLMLAPCANLFLLLLVNMSATRTLRRAGLHVGFMGVKPEEIERVVNPDLCSHCGYNLTGNVSGFCTECGRPLEWGPR